MRFWNSYHKAAKHIMLIAVLSTGFEWASAQQLSVDSLISKFDRYRVQNLTEKIYAHLDQSVYLTGEILWFKLYTVDGSVHQPSDVSKVAYFEILDQKNQPVLQAKISLKKGLGSGSLFLPASITSGVYTIRAYTNWMKNFSPDFFFHSTITIINSFRKLETEEQPTSQKPGIQFFPEGGTLVNGMKSKVAFRMVAQPDEGISPVLLNQTNDTLGTLAPATTGLGYFDFTPHPDEQYRVVIKGKGGTALAFKMPEAVESGYVMRVDDDGENQLSISIASNIPGSTNTPVYLFIHARNIISKAAMYILKDGSATVEIPKEMLLDGISHITLFDARLQPVCERLYFKPISKILNIDTRINQNGVGSRRKVSVALNISDDQGNPVSANLSMAVYRIDSLQRHNEPDIVSYLWLNADLNGNIESPGKYLSNGSGQSIDHVMLTNGWRRFVWKDVLAGKDASHVYLPEIRSHIIHGTVTNPSGTPTAGVKTYLSSPSKNIQIYGSISDDQGKVKYEMKDFYGRRKIIIQTNTFVDSTSQIKISSPFADSFSSHRPYPFQLSPALKKSILSRSVALQVQDVYYQEKNNKFKTASEDSTAFYGKADATYYLDDYTRFPVMEEVMREYVPGVMVRKRKDGFHFMNLDNVNKSLFDEDPMILLDGIPLFDVDKIVGFDPLLVKKLEVLNRRYYMGVLSMPGIVSYTTYTGDLAGFELDPRTITLDYDGLQLRREFYSPMYETPKQRASRLPDQRYLLHWNPDIVVENGERLIEFYTSDLEGDYRVVIEGISPSGHAGRASKTFSVTHAEN
jgi:hypothetical protein